MSALEKKADIQVLELGVKVEGPLVTHSGQCNITSVWTMLFSTFADEP